MLSKFSHMRPITSALSRAMRPFATSIDKFFNAKTYALVGGSRMSGLIAKNFSENKAFQARQGKAFIVDPKAKDTSLFGMPVMPTIGELPEGVDAACVVAPAAASPKLVSQCLEKGIRHIVVVAGGFAESSEDGKKLQDDMIAECKELGARVIGPNGMGVMDVNTGINTMFLDDKMLFFPDPSPALPKPVSVITQSGALGVALLNEMEGYQDIWSMSRLVSIGNAADVNENDCLESFHQDPNTKMIWVYLEGVRNAPHFLRTLRTVTKDKPVLMLKAARGDAGSQASGSHSASLATNDVVGDYLLKQAGAIPVSTWTDFFDMTEMMREQPLPKGRRVGVVTNAGGNGVMTSDAIDRHNMELPRFSEATVKQFYEALPDFFISVNPMDITASATTGNYCTSIKLALEDEGTDCVVVCLQPNGPKLKAPAETAADFCAQFKGAKKPIATVVYGGRPGEYELYKAAFAEVGVPCFSTPERAIGALAKAADYHDHLQAEAEAKCAEIPEPTSNAKINQILNTCKSEGRQALLEHEAREVFRIAGLPVPMETFVQTPQQAVEWYKTLPEGTRVVMKLVSTEVLHKSDEGAVFVGLKTAEEVEEKCAHLAAKFAERDFRGVLVYEMVPEGTEMIVGTQKDPAFGPVVLVGLGGEMVNVLNDSTFSLCPAAHRDAVQMIHDLKHQQVVEGFRGKPAVPVDDLADVVVKVSELAKAHPMIAEIDANPVIATEDGRLYAVDARIILGEE